MKFVKAVRSWFVWVWKMIRFLPYLATTKVEWEDANDPNSIVETEHWSRRTKFRVLRPRWYGAMKTLDCGCSRRFGRMRLYSMNCRDHSPEMANWHANDKDTP